MANAHRMKKNVHQLLQPHFFQSCFPHTLCPPKARHRLLFSSALKVPECLFLSLFLNMSFIFIHLSSFIHSSIYSPMHPSIYPSIHPSNLLICLVIQSNDCFSLYLCQTISKVLKIHQWPETDSRCQHEVWYTDGDKYILNNLTSVITNIVF